MQDLKALSDEKLVLLYKSGNERAFNELYSRYESKLKRLIYFYIMNSEDVDDIFHDVTLRVIRHINSFNLKLSFSSWIYQIAVNCSKNYINKKRRNESLVEKEKYRLIDSKVESNSPEEDLISKYDMKEFNYAINSLQDKFREVFVLRYEQSVKYQDIAKILNCSERTAKWRMKKAIEKITQYLKEKNVI